MISSQTIKDFCGEVIEKFQPEKIILFGSYAYGEPNLNSDIDLLVVLPFEGHPVTKAIEIRHAIDYHFALDLLVRSPQQLQKRLEMGDFFIREILQKGRVLYEADCARVG
ncbi:MAG: nucleotidyltransferase domain-containing protein [Cyanobacteria bacterium J06597_16]